MSVLLSFMPKGNHQLIDVKNLVAMQALWDVEYTVHGVKTDFSIPVRALHITTITILTILTSVVNVYVYFLQRPACKGAIPKPAFSPAE